MSSKRRIRTLGAVLLGILSLPVPLSAAAQESGADILRIRAVPGLEGIAFRVGGRRVVTDERGIAMVALDAGGPVRVRARALGLVGDRTRYDFVGWSDGSTNPEREVSVIGPVDVEAGFNIDHLVSWRLSDADGASLDAHLIDRVRIVDGGGTRYKVPGFSQGLAGPTAIAWKRYPPGSFWLRGTTVSHENGGFLAETISYEPQIAVADGVRIPARSEAYVPESTGLWPISLSAHTIKVARADLLFGGNGENEIELTYPGGRTRSRPLPPSGRLTMLPPGSYVAQTRGGGLALRSSFSVPASEDVTVRLLTYWDLAFIALVVAGLGPVVWLARRMRTGGSTEGASETDSFRPTIVIPASEPEGDNGSRQRSDFIRVHLRDGRSLDARRLEWKDERVLILDVVATHDENGEPQMPLPGDAFVSRQEIAMIESL